jgi:general secretion pathway protein K
MNPPRHPRHRPIRRRHPHHPRQRGFILVMTMWVLAAIAIAASYFAERVQTSLQLATARQSMNDGQIALSDARADLLFRLATTPLTPYGLGNPPIAVALDSRPYRAGDTVVQLQDARGLFNLNVFGDEQMQRFLATLGVPAEQRAGLIDTLRDYTDADDLRRLNGAESSQYKERGLPPPTNAMLMSPIELRNIIGWRDTPMLWQKSTQLLDLVNTDTESGINPNTAPWQVLTALPGVTKDIAKAIIDRRNIAPVGLDLIDKMLGTQMDNAMGLATAFPSGTVRVTQSANGLPWVLLYNLTLTPEGLSAPWTVHHFYRLEKKDATQAPISPDLQRLLNVNVPPKLPPRVALAASAPFFSAN